MSILSHLNPKIEHLGIKKTIKIQTFPSLSVLQALVEKGNTVLTIEHNLDIIKNVDWVIDLGPDAGINGGQVMFSGKISEFIKTKTHTAQALKKEINDT